MFPLSNVPSKQCSSKQCSLQAMFPLSNVPSKLCACARAHKSCMRRAHIRKLGAHINVPSKNAFAHVSYTSFKIQMSSGKMLHKRSFMRRQTLTNKTEHCTTHSLS